MLSQNPTRVELIQKGRQICRDGSQPPNRNPEAIPAWPLFFLVSAEIVFRRPNTYLTPTLRAVTMSVVKS